MGLISTIAFDADDTLWHNENHFHFTQSLFAEKLAEFADRETLDARLIEAERRNIHHYGFGVKGFVLSMIETAIDVTDGRVPAQVIGDILNAGRELLNYPVELLPGVGDTLEALASTHKLIVITKGDLFDQERKIAQSGVDHLFHAVEIVSTKDAAVYTRIFDQHGDGPDRSLMVGNSVRSDILPALACGAYAVHVPYHLTFALEQADMPKSAERLHSIASLDGLPPVVRMIDEQRD